MNAELSGRMNTIDSVSIIDGVLLSPLKIIDVPGGDILHGMTCSSPGYRGFGEAYFSVVNQDSVKAWKRHQKMVLNLVVPIGAIRFVIYDDRQTSSSYGQFQEIFLSKNNYHRLTVPPMVWMGFQGVGSDTNMLLNIADIKHDPAEADRKNLNEIEYDWELIE